MISAARWIDFDVKLSFDINHFNVNSPIRAWQLPFNRSSHGIPHMHVAGHIIFVNNFPSIKIKLVYKYTTMGAVQKIGEDELLVSG